MEERSFNQFDIIGNELRNSESVSFNSYMKTGKYPDSAENNITYYRVECLKNILKQDLELFGGFGGGGIFVVVSGNLGAVVYAFGLD